MSLSVMLLMLRLKLLSSWRLERRRKRENKSEEKKAEETAVKAPRIKCTERDPDDDATLTEIMKKKKVLEDKKKGTYRLLLHLQRKHLSFKSSPPALWSQRLT
ncbi:hypothetical protein Hanom_Chr05g00445071 [Helianthus anomalus]